MAENEIDIIIRARDNASRVLGGIGGAMKGLAGAAGKMALIGGGAMLALGGAVTVMGFKMNSTLETANIQFETLLGSSDAAKAHVESLFEFAAKTPFETQPILEASRLMLTFGGTALATEDNLRLVGDAAAGTSQSINDVGFWVGRAYAAMKGGQPFGEASMRLLEMGILSADARVEMEELSKAGAGADEIFAVLQGQLGKFDGSMIKLADTLPGLTSTISDNIQIASATAVLPFFNLFKEGLTTVANFVQSETFTGWAESVAGFLERVIDRGRELFGPIMDKAKEVFETTGSPMEAFKEALGGIADIIGGGEGEGLGGILSNLGNTFAIMLGPMGLLVRELLPALVPLFVALAIPLGEIATAIAPVLAELLAALATVIIPILVLVVKGLTAAIDKWPALIWLAVAAWIAFKVVGAVQAIIALTVAIWAQVTALLAQAVAMIAAYWPLLLVIAAIALLVLGIILLVKHWDEITAFLKTAWKVATAFIVEKAIWLKNQIVEKFEFIKDKVVTFFKELPGQLWAGFKEKASWLLGQVGEWNTTMHEKFLELLVKVFDVAKAIPGQIWAGILAAKDWLFDKFTGLIGDIVSKLNPLNWNWGSTMSEHFFEVGKAAIHAMMKGMAKGVAPIEVTASIAAATFVKLPFNTGAVAPISGLTGNPAAYINVFIDRWENHGDPRSALEALGANVGG